MSQLPGVDGCAEPVEGGALFGRGSGIENHLDLVLAQARANGTYPNLLRRIAKAQLLILDDFAIEPLGAAQRRDLLEVIEDRYKVSSTVVTSQLATDPGQRDEGESFDQRGGAMGADSAQTSSFTHRGREEGEAAVAPAPRSPSGANHRRGSP